MRYELETEQESLQALKTERREYESELEDLGDKPDTDVDAIDAQLRELRERKSDLESQVNELQRVIRFNEGMLDDDGPTAPVDLEARDDGALTNQLVDDAVTCWTSQIDFTDITDSKSIWGTLLTEAPQIQGLDQSNSISNSNNPFSITSVLVLLIDPGR